MPQPSFNFSAFRHGNGLTISKILNNKNAEIIIIKLEGKNSSEIHIPTISSITTTDGSLPNDFSKIDEVKTPIKKVKIINGIKRYELPIPLKKKIAKAKAEPAVPGTFGK